MWIYIYMHTYTYTYTDMHASQCVCVCVCEKTHLILFLAFLNDFLRFLLRPRHFGIRCEVYAHTNV